MSKRTWRGGPEAAGFARKLRNDPTDAERKLWQALRARRLLGFKFRRQYPCAGYVLDFVCLERKLVIEVDGSQHMNSARDQVRDRTLVAMGFRVLRFWDNEVLCEMSSVLEVIGRSLGDPLPNPPPLRGGGDCAWSLR